MNWNDRMMATAMAVSLAIVGTLVSCSSDDGSNDVAVFSNNKNEQRGLENIELTEAQKAMVAQSNSFSLQLMKTLCAENDKVVSPLSAACLLGMLNEGAQDAIQQETTRVLGFDNRTSATVNEFFTCLVNIVTHKDSAVGVDVANAIFTNKAKNVKLIDSYAEKMKQYYNAGIESLDFTQPGTLQRINEWSRERSRGMIENILSPAEFDSSALAYLLNAVSFKALWADEFDMDLTAKGKFTTTTGMAVECDMMTNTDNVGYMENSTLKAISLPYGKGCFRMVLILPNVETGLHTTLMDEFTVKRWKDMKEGLKNIVKTRIVLPRFTTTTETELIGPLMKMGIKKMFGSGDFSKMLTSDSDNLTISFMKQKARIEVNESGTEASAITIAGMVGADESGNGTKTASFVANRPFAYIISEVNTDAILFMGQYTGEE